jgi:hypothetical protein
MNKGKIYKIKDLFSKEEVDYLIKKSEERLVDDGEVDEMYGRTYIHGVDIPEASMEKLNKIISEMFKVNLKGHLSLEVEYNPKYGKPNLPPHLDGDKTEIILNYQLDSNTSWPCGVNTTVYEMENNSALIFNPNADVHWRPHKEFNKGEFVRMIFFRFVDPTKESDHSHVRLGINDPIFKDMNELRERLKQE